MKPTPSRRTLIKAAGASGAVALGFPTIVPSSVFGRNAPSNHLNLAAIGVGGRGFGNNWHNFACYDDVRYVAVADCFASRRNKFAADCNNHYQSEVCKAYADYREILQRDDVNGVVISTPDHWHVPIAYDAALAGKDMYVEKPLSIAMAWSKKLREAATKNNVIFQYGTQQRSMLSSQIAIDLVRNGYVGEIQRIDVWAPGGPKQWGNPAPADVPADLDYDRWTGAAPMKPYSKDRCTNQGGWFIYDYALGFLGGWGAHPLDLMQWAMDVDHTSPVAYEGKGEISSDGLADTVYTWDVNCRYEGAKVSGDKPVPVHFMSTDVAKPIVQTYHPRFRGDGTTFFGTDGWISVSRGACYMKQNDQLINTSNVQFKPGELRVGGGNSHARNFLDCMKTRRPTVNPLESAIRSDTISHLSDIAIRTGRKITWDPKTETILDDPAASKMLDRPMREPYMM